MMYLKINGVDIIHTKTAFSDGAISIKLTGALPVNPEFADISVLSTGKLQDELFEIASMVSVLRDLNNRIRIHLFMPYAPYARQDRRMVRHDAFSLKVYADLLNSLELDKVYILDAHSSTTPALFNNCAEIPQDFVLKDIRSWLGEDRSDLIIVSPDMGAVKKASKAVEVLGAGGIAFLNKKRNPATGHIDSVELMGSDWRNLEGKNLLIVDDICDGGGTFIQAAAELQKYGPRSIDLFVTHGIFSRGLQPLFDAGIGIIYTTNSIVTDAESYYHNNKLILSNVLSVYSKFIGNR